jgi:hypothetical protein
MLQTTEQSAELAAVSAASKERAEIESAIIIAKRMPRNEADAWQKLNKACQRQSFADAATYSFPRGDKEVTGPSVDLAREAARCWGNIRFGLRILRDDDSSRLIQGWCWDMETNVKNEFEDSFEKLIQRKNKTTQRTEWVEPDERDLRELTNRRGAILVRNAILQTVPKDLIEDALYQCEQSLNAKAKADPDATRKRLLADFATLNVTVAMIEKVLGHEFNQATADELTKLRAVHNSIAAGNSTWAEYAKSSEEGEAAKATADVNQQLQQQQETKKPETTKKQEKAPASHPGVPPGSKASAAPPGEPAQQGGGGSNSGEITDEQWRDIIFYLDEDPERIPLKNRAKNAVGLLPANALSNLPAEKRVPYVEALKKLAEKEGIKIDL